MRSRTDERNDAGAGRRGEGARNGGRLDCGHRARAVTAARRVGRQSLPQPSSVQASPHSSPSTRSAMPTAWVRASANTSTRANGTARSIAPIRAAGPSMSSHHDRAADHVHSARVGDRARAVDGHRNFYGRVAGQLLVDARAIGQREVDVGGAGLVVLRVKTSTVESCSISIRAGT